MKHRPTIAIICLFPLLFSCEKKQAPVEENASKVQFNLREADIPIFPLRTGDWWKYQVTVEVPKGLTEKDAKETRTEFEKMRAYLGKISPKEGRPEVDTFEIAISGKAIERELVEIYEDRVMMRGSVRLEESGEKLQWLEKAIPFVVAGMRPGVEMRPLSIHDGASTRVTKVIARETIEVPAGKFLCIRLLMTGNDGEVEIRRTTWFSPGIGIVKEEKLRYAAGHLLLSEITNLIETSVRK
jgi:hypothetical protein